MIKVKKRKILLLPGDGIGPEVIKEVRKIINWFNDKKSLDLKGWQIIDQYNNNINFSLNIISKNDAYKKGTFKIPDIN